ncbi:MFS transporter [Nocardia salmonicida]|uniref:MFS transporter n=1 Tax=Nocardia salmonicida TaxID=53431 RepID=UPI003687FABE
MTTPTSPSSEVCTQRRVLLLACLILFVDGYDLFTLGTIGPSLLSDPDWGATTSTLGILGTVTAVGMPLGSILAGWSADRWGRRTPMVIAVSWISVAMLAAAAATNIESLIAARFFTGIGIGALAPLVATFVTDGAPARRRTLHLAIAMGSIGVGGTVSALLGRSLLPESHFQLLFLLGGVPLVLVPAIWRLVPTTRVHRPDAAEHKEFSQLFTPRYRRGTILFWITVFSSMTLIYSTSAWLPAVMMKSGYNLGSSLEFLMAFTAGAGLGGVAVAILADRGHLRLVTIATFLLAAIALLTLSTNQPRAVLLIVCALAGLGSLGCQNLVIACMTTFYPPHLRATALGLGLGVGRFGAMAGPSYLAVVTAVFASPRAGFIAFTVPAVVAAATVALLPRTLAPAPEATRSVESDIAA